MKILNIFKSAYWLRQPVPAAGLVKWFWVFGFLGLVLAGLVLYIIRQKTNDRINREIYRRFANLGLTIGFFGLVWTFFRQEMIPILGMRAWLILLVLVFVFWLYKILKYTIYRAPQIRKENSEREALNKYLPKRK